MILIFFGIITGFVSGFFGLGGGLILVPLLLLSGYEMKSAVAISIMQMVFSSIYGSFLNYKTNKNILKDGITLGLGGFCGGLLSGIIVPNVDGHYLKYLFLCIVVLSIVKVYLTSAVQEKEVKRYNIMSLVIIGFVIGVIAMSIGVGGTVMLTPILVGYMFYNLKDATSLGLFFVIFSSIAGFISLSLSGHMLYSEGTIVGISALVGVFIGIKMKNIIQLKSYKNLILGLYILTFISTLFKL